jgi:hypothetical protein
MVGNTVSASFLMVVSARSGPSIAGSAVQKGRRQGDRAAGLDRPAVAMGRCPGAQQPRATAGGRPVSGEEECVACLTMQTMMILFRQRYPRWWFDFSRELTRFGYRGGAYAFLLVTDRYPPFSLR